VLGAAGVASRRKIGGAGGRSSNRTSRKALFPFLDTGKKTVVITGASSGLGLYAAKALVERGDWFVVMACKDFAKGEKVAKEMGFPQGTYQVMHCDLSANNSVRCFVQTFRALGRSLDCLVCNAAVYFPNAHKSFPVSGGGPRWSADGHELSFAANYLGHFLLTNLLLDDLKKASNARCIILGTVTATVNGKELGGMVPPLADLGDLSGLEKGMQYPITMIDGGEFDGAKAYKDSKVCDVLLMRELHKRYNKETGVKFMSLYPGCIAETQLFREHYPVFQKLFPAFHKNITRAYVSQEEAGRRLGCVVADPEYNESGSYYSWQGKSGTGGEGGNEAKDNKEETNDFFLNKGSFRTLKVDEIGGEAGNDEKAKKLWALSEKLVGFKGY